MKKSELIKAVLDNPSPASSSRILNCYGGFGAGYGRLEYIGKWVFYPDSATGYLFEPKDDFVKEVVGGKWRQLLRYYK